VVGLSFVFGLKKFGFSISYGSSMVSLNRRGACSLGKCSDDTPCGLHDSWKVPGSQIMNLLVLSMVAKLAITSHQACETS